MKVSLSTPLYSISNIGEKFAKRLEKLGLGTVRDLLRHFPSRYEDFSKIYKISELEPGQHATIQGTVEDVRLRKSWRRGMAIVQADISDETGTIKAVWFNQPYISNVLRPGRIANFAGKISVSEDNEIYLSHPAYEILSNKNSETKHTARLVPIYPETRGLTSKGLRFLMKPVLDNLATLIEWIPEEILETNGFPEVNRALRDIHFPKDTDDALIAKKRFEFEDLFLLQIYNLQRKFKISKERSPVIKTDIEKLKEILNELPFKLTESQKKSLWEIIKDIERTKPMNRLLQGDVGSGKTVVAALAALIASENGYQTAFMAPTEVLARQHFATLKKLFSKIGPDTQPTTALLTSSEARAFYQNDLEATLKKADLIKKIKGGEIKIVIGTHALIQKGMSFRELGFIVVDEQHRFGVKQRAVLTQNPKKLTPHFLSMSATPIPRTLTLTIFGDLDISAITELPAGRINITTKTVEPGKRQEAYEFMRKEIKSGRQVFVICPRIEVKDAAEDGSGAAVLTPRQKMMREIKSVKEEYEKLSRKIFPDFRVAMLHGQLPARGGSASGGKPTKESVMRDFRDGKTDVLVSTSVVEVGVDVPNATVMMIESAERFGLAQLYQFRGRVGGGKHKSYCLLFTDSDSKSAATRLRAVAEAKNGFELAEADLKLRGPGELFGEIQTGMPDYAMRALQDIELVKMSREAAVSALKKDVNLQTYPSLKTKLAEFSKNIHLE